LRALYGTDRVRNAVEGSQSPIEAKDVKTSLQTCSNSNEKEANFFFGGRRTFASTATLQNCTCLIIKPHSIASGTLYKLQTKELKNLE
jgi:nucleoside-diphosphate kinase